MNDNTSPQIEKEEESLRFVTRYYRHGAFDARKSFSKLDITCTSSYYRRRALAIAASIAVLIGIGYGIYVNVSPTPQNMIQLVCEENTKTYLLPDNSSVTLAKGATLSYNSSNFIDDRSLNLSGQAYFEVTHDASSPFTVKTATTSTTVLGTQFTVDETPDSTSVYVKSGKVKVSQGNRSAIVTDGMVAVCDGQSIHHAKDTNPNRLAWVDHRLQFDNVPLSHAVKEIENTYGVTITGIPDKDYRISLSYKGGADSLLFEINQLLDIDLKINRHAK